MLLQVQSLMW